LKKVIPICLLFIFIVIVQVYGIIACVKIARNKSIVASHRWAASMLVFMLPFVGVFLFKVLERSLRYKEYNFYSEEFIDRVLYAASRAQF